METLVAENLLISNIFAALLKGMIMKGNGPDICLTGYWPSVAMSSRRRDGSVRPTCKAWAIVLSMPTSAGDLSLVVRDWGPIGYELLQSLWRDRHTQSSSG